MVETPEFTTFAEILRYNASHHGAREAIVDGPRRLSFATLAIEVGEVIRAFAARRLSRGQAVAIWAPNSAEWIVATLAAICSGLTIVPINTRLRGAEASWIIRRSDAKLLFTVRSFLGTDYHQHLLDADPGLTDLPVVFLPQGRGAQSAEFEAFVREGQSIPETEVRERLDAVLPDDESNVLFTSGTTGQPKGVVHTHRTNLLAFQAYASHLGVRSGDRLLLVLPMALNFGLCMLLMHFLRASTCVLEATFDPQLVLQRVQDEHITTLPGPPTLLADTMDAPGRSAYDLTALRIAITGATTISPAFVKRLREENIFEVVFVVYGLTEIAGAVTASRPDDNEDLVAEYCGVAIDGVELRLVDAEDQDVDRGQPGEILVRAETAMRGYVNDPDATAHTFLGEWLRTGDIGVLTNDGYLKITDRKKEVFIVGGMNVYPAEVERLMADHPAISQVAVVGVPDERLGEVGYAFVILRAGAAVSDDELIEWSRSVIANYKCPRVVEFVSEFPVNASMKVLKNDLRALALKHREERFRDAELMGGSV